MGLCDQQRRRSPRRRYRYRIAGLFIIALLSAAVVSGCSGSDSADSEPSSTAASGEAVEAPADQQSSGNEPQPSEASEGDEAASVSCARAYNDESPWNTPIGASPDYHPNSDAFVESIEAPLTSDPTQYTYPVYVVSGETPKATVNLNGWYSQPTLDGRTFGNEQYATVEVPIPAGAMPATGDDAQVIVLDTDTGGEWGFYNFVPMEDGTFEAENGYQYNVDWDGVAPMHPQGRGFVARGAGIPYLGGLVRPCEIEQGLIEHALALSYDSPRNAFVAPATKSDGASTSNRDVPEGARLQLDPAISEDEIREWGCEGACLTVARALQEYGLFVVDNAGRSKLYFEYEGTANWDGAITSNTVSPIPVEHLRVLSFETPTVDE